jgi:FkbM family methyltransferase
LRIQNFFEANPNNAVENGCRMNSLTRILRREVGRRVLPLVSSKDAASSLRDLRRRIGSVTTVVDVGASDGRWARMAERRFPDARYLLVEANTVHERALARYSARRAHVSLAFVAATESDGRVAFDASDPFGGLAQRSGMDAGGFDEVPGRSLDSLAQEHGLGGPFLVKLDTGGHEREILAGSARMLADTAALFVEAYNPLFCPSGPPLWELCGEIVSMGFELFDLVEPLYGPSDGEFWQADLVFVRPRAPSAIRQPELR